MMKLLEAAKATGGCAPGGDAEFVAVSTDSRRIGAGELFVALKGEHFDGHDYVGEVLARGAVAAMVDSEWAAQHGAGLPLVVVADTRLALGALAADWRSRFELPLIGITGSNGKTTVKEMCAAICREQAIRDGFDPELAVLATTGNLNNDIGLPLMLLRLRSGHRAAVIEMGMNHPGEIDYLSGLARPTVALVNNAQRAHLAGLGSMEAVARAKGEIFAGLGADGIAVINLDDAYSELWRDMAGARRSVGFSLDGGNAVELAEARGTYQAHGLGGVLTLTMEQGDGEVILQVPGEHNARNALAAAATTLAAGISMAAVVAGLSGYRGIKGRLQRRVGISGAAVIDDSYNANPDSMRAAIDVLASIPGQTILVMGDMGETGEAAGQFHDEIGGYAKSCGLKRLFALGDLSVAAAANFGHGGQHFDTIEALLKALRPELDAASTVLVKGSRFMKMERVVDAITAETKEPHAA
jgi:UDP-N-acetylmuramoyl-tripeptide--D-alanyl-D-alanine ligase